MILVEKIHAERIARVRTALESCGLTQMIVCDPKSVWYLTGVAVEPYVPDYLAYRHRRAC